MGEGTSGKEGWLVLKTCSGRWPWQRLGSVLTLPPAPFPDFPELCRWQAPTCHLQLVTFPALFQQPRNVSSEAAGSSVKPWLGAGRDGDLEAGGTGDPDLKGWRMWVQEGWRTWEQELDGGPRSRNGWRTWDQEGMEDLGAGGMEDLDTGKGLRTPQAFPAATGSQPSSTSPCLVSSQEPLSANFNGKSSKPVPTSSKEPPLPPHPPLAPRQLGGAGGTSLQSQLSIFQPTRLLSPWGRIWMPCLFLIYAKPKKKYIFFNY